MDYLLTVYKGTLHILQGLVLGKTTKNSTIAIRVGPDLVFLAGCRMSSACQIRPDMPDIRPDNPAKWKIRPDDLAEY